MPIFVNEYEWYQNGSLITVKLGLRGRKSKNVDIVLTNSYIKVNFSPYLFEVFLSHKVDPTLSSSKIKDGQLHFNLIKVSNQEWDSLSIKPIDKQEALKLRNEALEEYNQLQSSKAQSKLEVTKELSNLAISKQIEVNEKHHELYKKKLIEETSKFFNDDNTENISTQEEEQLILRARLCSTGSEEGSCIASEVDYDGDEESLYHSLLESIPTKKNRFTKEAHYKMKEKVALEKQGPRQCSVIKICHSTHKLGIPRRKSTSQMQSETVEDTEAVFKQDENIEKKEAIDTVKKTNLQIIENNNNFQPDVENLEELSFDEMKKEAKLNFENGMHDEAIRLYSRMIEVNPHLASNHSNRAASYLALNMNEKAVKDCTKALALLVPLTEENLKSRLLCFIRRGTSYVHLHKYRSGLADYKAALKLDPQNKSLANDVVAINLLMNTSSDTGDEEDTEYQKVLEKQMR